ncbi:MAG: hypothetical protein Q9199_004286 [Rusavskia elegans]
MDNSGASCAVKNLILENPRFLKHLCLGAEDAAVRDAHDPGYSMRPEVNLNVQKLVDDIEIEYDDYNRREAANDWGKDHRKLKQRGPFANPWLHLDSCELKCLDDLPIYRYFFTPLSRHQTILRPFWIGTDGICDRLFGTKEM